MGISIFVIILDQKSFLRVLQSDHLSGTPRNLGDFDTWRGNCRDFSKSQGKKSFDRKVAKTVYCYLVTYLHPCIAGI